MNSLKNVKILFDKFRVILTKQQKSWAAVLFVMTVVGAIFEAAGVSAVLPLINVIIDPEALRNHEIGAKLLAPFPGITDEGIMFLTASGVIVVYIFKIFICPDLPMSESNIPAKCRENFLSELSIPM